MVRTKVCEFADGEALGSKPASAGKIARAGQKLRMKNVSGVGTNDDVEAITPKRVKAGQKARRKTLKKRTNDDEGKTSNVRVQKQATTWRKPQKRSMKQPQHVLADDTGHEAVNQTSSGTFL